MVTDERARAKGESAWQPPERAQLLVAAAGQLLIGVLYLAVPDRLTLGPPWLLLLVESIPLLALLLIRVTEREVPYKMVRGIALSLLVILTVAIFGSVLLLVADFLEPSRHIRLTAGLILRAAALLWAINVLVFATWFWEIDGGGPVKRAKHGHRATDLQFPQQSASPDGSPAARWAPGFVDYLFAAFTFATALSPADTLPLTQRAKLLVMLEAVNAGIIIVLLAARAVNIAGS